MVSRETRANQVRLKRKFTATYAVTLPRYSGGTLLSCWILSWVGRDMERRDCSVSRMPESGEWLLDASSPANPVAPPLGNHVKRTPQVLSPFVAPDLATTPMRAGLADNPHAGSVAERWCVQTSNQPSTGAGTRRRRAGSPNARRRQKRADRTRQSHDDRSDQGQAERAEASIWGSERKGASATAGGPLAHQCSVSRETRTYFLDFTTARTKFCRSLGETPGILPAWPRVSGRTRESF